MYHKPAEFRWSELNNIRINLAGVGASLTPGCRPPGSSGEVMESWKSRKESHRSSVQDAGSGRFRCAGLPEMSSPHA